MTIKNISDIDRGFANLAGLFAPPDSGELANYALARQRNEDAQRRAELFARAGNAGITPEEMQSLDQQMAVVNGGWGQSRWKYGLDDATTRRGQDMTAATALRGQDVDAETSRANNANTVRGSALADLYGPLSPGQVRPEVPASAAGMIGLPAMPSVAGAPKPLSETEWNAQQNERLRQSGVITDQQFADMIMGKEAPVKVAGPNGPAFMSPGAAVRTGARPAAPEVAPSELANLQNERATIAAASPSDPRLREYDARIGALGRGAAQDAYSVESDKAFAKQNQDVQSTAASAQSRLSTLGYIGRLLDAPNMDTGAGAEGRLQLRKAAQALGIDVGDVGSAEALAAVSNQFALELRNPESGAGMPGALSDSDRRFLQSMVPGLQNTPAGNRQILGFASRVAQRAVDVERLRQEYVRQHGRIDEGFAAAVSNYAAANPLFPEVRDAAPPAAPSSGGSGGFRILKVE